MVMNRMFRRDFVGREVIDSEGQSLGTVADVWPTDGGGEPEMLLVKLGRFARRKYVPIEGTSGGRAEPLQLPFTKLEIDDAPDAEDIRWGDPGMVARAHWRLVAD